MAEVAVVVHGHAQTYMRASPRAADKFLLRSAERVVDFQHGAGNWVRRLFRRAAIVEPRPLV